MQYLGVAERLFPEIERGEKRSTIRWREGEFVPGLLTYVCDGTAVQKLVVMITKVTRMPLSQAADYLGRGSDWPPEVMLAGMREHYSSIEWHDEVSVIEHLSPEETAHLIRSGKP